MDRNSIWFALRNKRFRTLWLVTLISSSAVAAYNTAAVWLMNSLASSSFFLSLIPVVTSLAFFLFTLPAGIIADVMSRSKAITLINFGLAVLCLCLGVTVSLGWINPLVLLFGVLCLGIAWTVAASELWLVEQRVASKETRGRANAVYMVLANVGLLFGGLFWGWLATIAGLDLTFHIATLAIMLSMPLCVIWSLDPVDGMWRLALCESGCNWVHNVGRFSNRAMQATFDFRVPAEATQRFEDLLTQTQRDFVRWGASDFRVLNVVSKPCDYRVEIIFFSEPRFREFESDQGAKVSEA